VAPTEPLGIDLAKRGHEVRKLLFAGFGHRITRSGYDPDDVLQEIYRGLLARNKGRCPFDSRKSSFGHYVHMVCECVLNNFHRKQARIREIEQVGMSAPASMRDEAEEFGGMVDAAEVADRLLVVHQDHWSHPEGDDGTGDAMRRLADHLGRKDRAGIAVDPLEARVAGMLSAGLNRREIAQQVGVSQGRVVNAIASLREHVTDWL
jgi:DNA-directed RNA polymerase specialized sigma24 family protein